MFHFDTGGHTEQGTATTITLHGTFQPIFVSSLDTGDTTREADFEVSLDGRALVTDFVDQTTLRAQVPGDMPAPIRSASTA